MRAFLREKYQIDLANIVIEQPPKVEMGEFALPLSFELAKRLRKAPRKIAEEIVAELVVARRIREAGSGGRRVHQRTIEAGPRGARARASGETIGVPGHAGEGAANVSGKILVEHTSINPNKAAHIGHLRNAILGDTFVRLLRSAGHPVDVQNYIDNTGVQVADVVVGFLHLEKKSKQDIAQLIAATRVLTFTAGTCMRACPGGMKRTRRHLKVRLEALHAIEQVAMRWPMSLS